MIINEFQFTKCGFSYAPKKTEQNEPVKMTFCEAVKETTQEKASENFNGSIEILISESKFPEFMKELAEAKENGKCFSEVLKKYDTANFEKPDRMAMYVYGTKPIPEVKLATEGSFIFRADLETGEINEARYSPASLLSRYFTDSRTAAEITEERKEEMQGLAKELQELIKSVLFKEQVKYNILDEWLQII